MAAEILVCDNPTAASEAAKRGADVLREGGVVIFPTETVYGVAAVSTDNAGYKRLWKIKQRNDDKPFTIHLGSADEVARYVDVDADAMVRRVVCKAMPGPITLVSKVTDAVIETKLADMQLDAKIASRLYFNNTVGLRCPDHPVSQAFLCGVNEPVVASSANLAGQPPPLDANQAIASLGEEVDLVLDGGCCRFSKPSTVVKVADGSFEMLREGVYDKRFLAGVTRQMILFVCTGNTCRSPMAELIARDELNRRGLVDVDVASAGVFASGGSPMPPEAVEAMRKMDVPVHRHASQPLSEMLIRQADEIFVMTSSHLAAVLDIDPQAKAKTLLLDDANPVADPIGAPVDVYVECAEHLKKCIRQQLDELNL